MTPSEKTDHKSNCERRWSSQSRRRRALSNRARFTLAQRWGVPPRTNAAANSSERKSFPVMRPIRSTGKTVQ